MPPPRPPDPYSATRVVWVLMLVAIAMYAVLVTAVPRPEPAAGLHLTAPLLALAALLAAASIFVRRKLFRGSPRNAYLAAFVMADAAALLGVIAYFAAGAERPWAYFLLGAAALILNAPRREDFPA